MRRSFRIVTLGCKVNHYESAYLFSRLQEAGWEAARPGEISDVTIVNTCIVTQAAAHQSRQAIRKAIREGPEGFVAAVGCYGQVFPEELQEISELRLIGGNAGKEEIVERLLGSLGAPGQVIVRKNFDKHTPFQCLEVKAIPERSRAYLKIQDGCESFCSYCVVPYARGPYRSLSPKKVLLMLDSISKAGYREAVLTGIHLGKYGVDLVERADLKGLLADIGREHFPLRIRLSSLEPMEIDEALICLVATESWLCPHFHVPLQSGDNGILKKMRRTYKASDFASVIERIRDSIPYAGIGVDVMAGFPGEDVIAYSNTFSLIKDLPISYLHVFPYSSREGTTATAFEGQNNPRTIKKRASELRELGKEKRMAFYRSCLGKEFQVLVEGWYSKERRLLEGKSENYIPIVFPGSHSLKNRLTCVRINKVENDKVFGEKIKDL